MADNEVVVSSGRKLAIGNETWEIRDSGEPIKFADLLLESRHINGIVYLSFGASLIDYGNNGVADTVCRLRFNLATAQQVHSVLGDMIADALKPIDKSSAN